MEVRGVDLERYVEENGRLSLKGTLRVVTVVVSWLPMAHIRSLRIYCPVGEYPIGSTR